MCENIKMVVSPNLKRDWVMVLLWCSLFPVVAVPGDLQCKGSPCLCFWICAFSIIPASSWLLLHRSLVFRNMTSKSLHLPGRPHPHRLWKLSMASRQQRKVPLRVDHTYYWCLVLPSAFLGWGTASRVQVLFKNASNYRGCQACELKYDVQEQTTATRGSSLFLPQEICFETTWVFLH